MNRVWGEPVDTILRVGRSLEAEGHYNWALTRKQSLEAIEQLESVGVGLFGGDVYIEVHGTLYPDHSNWFSDPRPSESKEDFVRRSLIESRTYIDRFPVVDAYFVFVPTDYSLL